MQLLKASAVFDFVLVYRGYRTISHALYNLYQLSEGQIEELESQTEIGGIP